MKNNLVNGRGIQSRILFITLGILMMLLSACATQTYKESKSSRDYGYQDVALEEGRYRITFRDKNIDNAYDFALLRAAEVSLSQGYTWFRVTSSFTDGTASGNARPGVVVGVGNGSRHSNVGMGVGILVDNYNEMIVYTLDIQLGKGEQPEGENIYNAASVHSTIGPRAEE